MGKYYSNRSKPEPILLGKIGAFDVKAVEKDSVPCLVIDRTWLSPSKIKAVLDNDDACRQFLAQYDKSEEPEAKGNEKLTGEVLKLRAELAQLRAQKAAEAQQPGNGRFNPEAATAAEME